MDTRRDPFFVSGKKNMKKEKFKKNDSEEKEQLQKKFDEKRPIQPTTAEEKVKKPFDKKTYRLKKYSKKYKLEQWEEQRKKKLLHEYYKETKDDPILGKYKPKSFDADEPDAAVGQFVRHPDFVAKEPVHQKTKKDPYAKAKEKLQQIKQEKIEKQKEIEKTKEETKQKLQEYKKKKQDRFKKLSRKTKKGQPVMTGRLELLLEKIQKSK